MNRLQHPNTYQPLLFAPSELLACGLHDAHHHPLVGERTAGRRRSVLAHVTGESVGASSCRVAAHGKQLLLARSRLRFEGESGACVGRDRGRFSRSSTAQRRCEAVGFGSSSTWLESANTRPPRGVGAAPATRGLRTYHGVLHGHAPGRPGLCWRPGLQPCPR